MYVGVFMSWETLIKNMPVIGWVTIITLILFAGVVVSLFYQLVKDKDIRLKDVEILQQEKKELYHTEGKNILDNQTSNAHHILKKIWIEIFDIGKNIFGIQDGSELFILEDIAHLIEGKLNYEIKNDLTRNHITEKSDLELQKYSAAKAVGYYNLVLANLYVYNIQLPNYNLPDIMKHISEESYKKYFEEIYFNARKIAGGQPRS